MTTTDPPIIRNATTEDYNSISKLSEENDVHFHADFFNIATIIDPQSCLVAEYGRTLVGYILCINLSHSLSMFGYFIVKSDYQTKGIGILLFYEAIIHVGQRNLILNSSENMVEKYRTMGGFKSIATWRMNIYSKEISTIPAITTETDVTVMMYNKECLEQIVEYDSNICLTPRKYFLEHWFGVSNSSTFVAIKDNKICGYGSIYFHKLNRYIIGPLYADSNKIAQMIFLELIHPKMGLIQDSLYVQLLISDSSSEAVNLFVEELSFNLEKVLTRLYTLEDIPLNFQKVFAITSSSMWYI